MSTYTNEKNAQIVLALLKEHGIKKAVISPGSTNIPIVGSMQNDAFFETYSCVDERSAAYLACGLAHESGEAVVLSCTGATASLNYLPGMTEAFYRKLPIIALTSFTGNEKIGHHIAQIIDRTVLPKDSTKISVQLPVIKDDQDEWHCNTLVNTAINEALSDGGGPVHINLPSTYSGIFNVQHLPHERIIKNLTKEKTLPSLSGKKIAIFVGSRRSFNSEEVKSIEAFCSTHNAIVACDHTSSYKGKFRVQPALIAGNFRSESSRWKNLIPDTVIHIGEVSGDYFGSRILLEAKEVWRISEDGKIRDTSHRLKYYFRGEIFDFFSKFPEGNTNNSYFNEWEECDKALRAAMPELPFSNIAIARKLSEKLQANTSLYLGILNTLRSWNFFPIPSEVNSSSNVGGFGIDGCLSTAVGGSLANSEKTNIAILGDLAFFYDMNILGNRHLPKNLRILLINNGCGVEFNNSSHIASWYEGGANRFIAAGGHFKSGIDSSGEILPADLRAKNSLAKVWCEANDINYHSATTMEQWLLTADTLVSSDSDKPILVECFTTNSDESNALETITRIDPSSYDIAVNTAKKLLPPNIRSIAKNALQKIKGKND